MTRRGVCVVCGGDAALRVDGTVWMHHNKTRFDWSGRTRRCDGAGKPPVPVVVRQARTVGQAVVSVPDISTWETT